LAQPPRLHVVERTPEPDTAQAKSRSRLKAQERPAEMLSCPRCSGLEFTQTIIGALLRNGRLVGGTKQLVCVACLAKGERVAVI